MARPRTFDETEVLGRARDAFWARGYTATSLADLEKATGLRRTSLYAAFGDKRQLFTRVLEAYRVSNHELIDAIVGRASDYRSAAKALWDLAIEQAARDKNEGGRCRGCLIANTTTELGNVDDDISAYLANNLAAFKRKLAPLLRADADLSADQAGDYVFAVYTGLNGLAITGAPVSALRAVAAASGGVLAKA